jgi:anhydro-N-acetylmuramic acid kinase
MSGTSLDAVDVGYLHFCFSKHPKDPNESSLPYPVEILEWRHFQSPYTPELQQYLLEVQQGRLLSVGAFTKLHHQLGQIYAETAHDAFQSWNLNPNTIDVIGCHGQTLFHQPPTLDTPLGQTLQLGELAYLAQRFPDCPVVGDFRPLDMAGFGQGAPLVPFADALLFGSESGLTCVQNLGGIGNVTVVPKLGSPLAETFAFDTGPANMLLDLAAQLLLGKPYDIDGETAREGTLSLEALATLQTDSYCLQPPPKSTGRERYGKPYLEAFLNRWGASLSAPDVLATLTEFTAWTVADAYQRFVFPKGPVAQIVFGGGGTYNRFLMDRLQVQLTQVCQTLGHPVLAIETHQQRLGLSDQVKEAVAFGLLAWARFYGLPNTFSSVTGTQSPLSLGHLLQAAPTRATQSFAL